MSRRRRLWCERVGLTELRHPVILDALVRLGVEPILGVTPDIEVSWVCRALEAFRARGLSVHVGVLGAEGGALDVHRASEARSLTRVPPRAAASEWAPTERLGVSGHRARPRPGSTGDRFGR